MLVDHLDKNPAAFKIAEGVIYNLRAYDCDDSTYHAAIVREIVRGIGRDVFIELDERPGQFHGSDYGDWHWKLRRARNNDPLFFDAINETPKDAVYDEYVCVNGKWYPRCVRAMSLVRCYGPVTHDPDHNDECEAHR